MVASLSARPNHLLGTRDGGLHDALVNLHEEGEELPVHLDFEGEAVVVVLVAKGLGDAKGSEERRLFRSQDKGGDVAIDEGGDVLAILICKGD